MCMQEFHIQGNALVGTIPESLVKQQALISLRLDDNQLRYGADIETNSQTPNACQTILAINTACPPDLRASCCLHAVI